MSKIVTYQELPFELYKDLRDFIFELGLIPTALLTPILINIYRQELLSKEHQESIDTENRLFASVYMDAFIQRHHHRLKHAPDLDAEFYEQGLLFTDNR